MDTVKAYLKEKKITQKEVSTRLGLTSQAVSLQLKQPRFNRNTARKWSLAMGFSETFLLTGQGELMAPGRQYGKPVKRAVLVSFVPTTRLVIEIPEGMSLEEWMLSPQNSRKMSRLARRRMARDIGDYLCIDNMKAREDTEMPAGEDESPTKDEI